MPFLRVRDRLTKHEYDVPVAAVKAWPDQYDVIDKDPVASPRPAKHHVKRSSAPKSSVGKTNTNNEKGDG